MLNRISYIKHVLLAIAAFSFSFMYGQNDSIFEKHIFVSFSNDSLPYRFMRPQQCDSSKKYPLVIFLHGAGERGNDNTMQLTNGAKKFASDSNREKYPCYLLAPQCAKGFRWTETDWKLPSHTMPSSPSIYLKRTMLLLDSLIKNLNIDTNRIYITGLSMGGFGTWDAICRWPEKFAAAVPVCGGADTAKAAVVKNIPVWAFHGEMDKLVMVSRSRNMINAIIKAGGNPKYTEYPGIAHNCWVNAYAEPEMYKWMFAQSRKNN
ncbi:MAG TPA: prolyl oligopeptidase family serine peptidase [Bacteroidales bacterium]|nr:prolyl oligopeptidase family serine peptidase [Bacteroidales bacterium]HPS15684.1 prolyl oligopeptidase family serine peptidase [Bacteroidales bacterium]